jgi:hypothetical protein
MDFNRYLHPPAIEIFTCSERESLCAFHVMGFWFILFLTSFLLFDPLNEAFGLEEAILNAFPDQAPYYETDAQWAERRRAENAEERALKNSGS